MMLAFMAMLAGSAAAPDQPIRRTIFNCSAWESQADPNAIPGERRNFSILLNGGGPFEPVDTLDPKRVLSGGKIAAFRVSKLDPLEMVAHTGPTDPVVWLLVLKPKKIGQHDGFDLDLINQNETRLGGFCIAFGKVAGIAELKAFADNWNARK